MSNKTAHRRDASPSKSAVAEAGTDLETAPVIDVHRLHPPAPSLPSLVIDRADLPGTARALGRHLAASMDLFERGPRVVKIVRTTVGYRFETMNVHSIVIAAHDVCQPIDEQILGGKLVRENVTLPERVAKLYLNLNEARGLPELRGICAAPLLADDGDIRCNTGYDRATGLWCVGVDLPAIPDRPTLENAQQALRLIRATISTFPFADAKGAGSSKSTVDLSEGAAFDETGFILALITAVCRPSLALAPALLIRAPQLSGSGTGKGLLVHTIAQVAFGQDPKAFTSNGNRQELAKRIESALIESGPIVFLDNCNAELIASNILAQAITESTVMTRLLGQSKMVPLTTNAFIALTGNAVRISEDLARRFVIVELDAHCENPEHRLFSEDFSTLIKARRALLLAAVLTIWRWGRQAALPHGIPLGSFEQWSSWCRDPLLALGCVDPVQRAAGIKSEDPLRQLIYEFLQAWHAAHGSRPIKLRDLHPDVGALIGGSRQKLATFVQSLDGARAGGLSLIATKPPGKWGSSDYAVHRYDTTAGG